MDIDMVTQVLREGVWVAIKLGGPHADPQHGGGCAHSNFSGCYTDSRAEPGLILKLIVVIMVLLGGRELDDADPSGLRPQPFRADGQPLEERGITPCLLPLLPCFC